MIEIRNLSKIYENKIVALKNMNLRIGDGEIFGIIGMSGAGKSTLLRCLALLEKPTTGEILIDGVDISRLEGKKLLQHRKKIGVIFQGYNLLMQKTVSQNIAFPLELGHESREKINARVAELLKLVDLQDKADCYPASLSGGQKQRVAIARALAAKPNILLCDEPTSALDNFTTTSILQLLADINRKTNVTMIVITHEIGVVREICSSVAVIENGEFAEHGSTESIINAPKSTAARRLLGAAIKMNDTISLLIKGTLETLYMTSIASVFAYIFGVPLGILAFISEPNGLRPSKKIDAILGGFLNIFRSIPFIILIVALIPLTHAIVGSSIGATAACFPLVIGAAPFVARMVQTSLGELDRGVIEAAQAMGATNLQIITKVYLPEAMPSIVRGMAITAITLVGYSAMAGTVGAGGLGDIAIRYGCHRYQTDIMMMTIVLLVVIVQILHFSFNKIATIIDKR